MTRPLVQIDDQVREMNDEEFAVYEENLAIAEEKKAQEEAEIAAKANAKAELLERLGITADEAKLLLA
jgi:PDZ domain-containing secreted protein